MRSLVRLAAATVLAIAAGASAAPPIDGAWRIDFKDGTSGIMQFRGGVLFFTDERGGQGQSFAYVQQGDVVQVTPAQGKPTPPPITILADGRLRIDFPTMGTHFLVPTILPPTTAAGSRPALPSPPDPATWPPLATEPVPPVRGLYVVEGGRPADVVEFGVGAVSWFADGRLKHSLPFQQQGNRVIVQGPHMSDTYRVLQDGRLMLTREGMRPVFLRKQGG